jgi:metal transporter CNNM
MAIVSRISVEKAASVKNVVKRGLTQRLRDRVGMGESDSGDEESEEKVTKGREKVKDRKVEKEDGMSEYEDMDGEATLKGEGVNEKDFANSNSNSSSGGGREKGVSFTNSRSRGRSRGKNGDGRSQQNTDMELGVVEDKNKPRSSFVQLPFAGLEQSMPADAVLAKEGAEDVSDRCFALVKWG